MYTVKLAKHRDHAPVVAYKIDAATQHEAEAEANARARMEYSCRMFIVQVIDADGYTVRDRY